VAVGNNSLVRLPFAAMDYQGQRRHIAAIGVPVDEESLTQGLLSDVDEELTIERADESQENEELMNWIKVHGLLYGIFVGFFVECGAIIAHVLIQTKFFNHSPTNAQIFLFSLTWASVTSVLPCVALTFLRSILLASHRIVRQSDMPRDSRLDMVLWSLESRFGVGSFLGVSLAVTLLDMALGLTSHIFLTATLLAVVVAAFSVMNVSRGEPKRDDSKTTDRLLTEPHRKVMDSVDPACLTKVEIKAGSLMLV
jgi:hypothetical protein